MSADFSTAGSVLPEPAGVAPPRRVANRPLATLKTSGGDADDWAVTSRTRCPNCSASLPLDAVWCSLCHADLRPAPEPAAQYAVVSTGPDPATPGAVAAELLDPAEAPAPLPPVRGRHRRTDAPEPAAAQSPPADLPEPARDVPLGADGRPDVEAAAARMLAELAATDSAAAVPDVGRIPGGKWGLLFGGMALVVALCLVVAAIAAVFVH